MVKAAAEVGIDARVLLPLGIYELLALALLFTPRFRALDTLLFTAFLGGATAAHLLVSHTPFTFPIVTGFLLWVVVVCLNPSLSQALGLENQLVGEEKSYQGEKQLTVRRNQ